MRRIAMFNRVTADGYFRRSPTSSSPYLAVSGVIREIREAPRPLRRGAQGLLAASWIVERN